MQKGITQANTNFTTEIEISCRSCEVNKLSIGIVVCKLSKGVLILMATSPSPKDIMFSKVIVLFFTIQRCIDQKHSVGLNPI